MAEKPLREAPDIYDPTWGPVQEWVNCIEAWAAYWKATPHDFEPCKDCADCDKCYKCGVVHEEEGESYGLADA